MSDRVACSEHRPTGNDVEVSTGQEQLLGGVWPLTDVKSPAYDAASHLRMSAGFGVACYWNLGESSSCALRLGK